MAKGFMVKHREPIIDTNVYLYNEGDEKTALTGGWDANNCSSGAVNVNGRLLLTKNQSNFYGQLAKKWQIVYRGTVNKVSMENIRTLKANIDFTRVAPAMVRFYLQSVNEANPFSAFGGTAPIAQTSTASNFSGVMSIDVSALSGLYYVFIALTETDGTDGVGSTLTVNKIWGEL